MTRTGRQGRTLLTRLRGRRRGAGGDEGVALVAVLGTMAVVTLLLLGSLALVVSAMRPARASEDSTAAQAAAQAGLDDYISRLNAQDSYWAKGNTDASNPALVDPAVPVAAGHLGVPVPGSSGTSGAATTATFRYGLLNSGTDIATSGTIQLKVTGTSTAPGQQPVSRTLVATLGVKGFLHYIYFTDTETTDPSLISGRAAATAGGSSYLYSGGSRYTVLASPAHVLSDCSAKYWQGRTSASYVPSSSDSASSSTATRVVDSSGTVVGTLPGWGGYGALTIASYCPSIQFVTNDTIRGPLHSNDALWLSGTPTFGSPDTTVYWPTAPTASVQPATAAQAYWGAGSPSAGTAAAPGYAPQRQMDRSTDIPQGNTSLLKYVLPKTDSDPNTDRPGCLYTGATKVTYNADGTVTVLSPNTTTDVDGCYHGKDPSQRSRPQTLTRTPPLLYVAPATGACTGVGYPQAGESTTKGVTTDYTCTNGTAFVSGTVHGQSTVAAANDVVVVGDTTYSDSGAGTDVLGLVAAGYVWVYKPVTASGALLLSTPVLTIDAAVLSLQHSFLSQNWDQGGRIVGKLTVLGSITQKYRGPVGTGGGTGYIKDYVYDARLDNVQPPYFLQPVSAPWTVKQVTDGQSR